MTLNSEFEQLTYAVYDPTDGSIMAAFRQYNAAAKFAVESRGKVMSTIGEWDDDKGDQS